MWPHNGPLLPWWLQGWQMTRVPWGWADAPVLWIFPERALGRKVVLSLKLKGGGRQEWTLCSLGGDSFWGDNMDQETPVLGTQGTKCPYFSVPTYPCLCCLLAAFGCLYLAVSVCACQCLPGPGPRPACAGCIITPS